MQAFEHVTELCPRRGTGEDRVAVVSSSDGVVIALADGASGTPGGERAASAVISAVGRAKTDDWPTVLAEVERDPDRLGPGQTGAVVISLGAAGVHGASVGDLTAWIVRRVDATQFEILELTQNQQRTPLIGDHSRAIGFRTGPLAGGTLIVASDGLFKHATQAKIVPLVLGDNLGAAAGALAALVRGADGQMPDDVTIVLCRERAGVATAAATGKGRVTII